MNPRRISSPSIAAILVLGCMTTHAAVDFKKDVLPVVEAKCLKCHKAAHEENGKKIEPKAGLRLDAAWAMLKGGESKRPAVVAKDTAKSYIYEVVNLPKDDDMFMPPKGDPLTAEEITKLKAWIEEGADFGGWEGNLEGKPADAATAKPVQKDREHDKIYKALSEGVQPPSAEATKKVQAVGAQVSILQVGGPLVRVDFLTGVSKCNDESVAGLSPIKDNIVHLDLARTSITDAALKTAASFPRLTRIDLRKTKVTDKGLESLTGCKHLYYINLFGTEVTDAGLATLASIKTLRNFFLFETKVTEAGIAKLKAALPQAEIVGNVAMPTPQAGGGEGGAKKKKNK